MKKQNTLCCPYCSTLSHIGVWSCECAHVRLYSSMRTCDVVVHCCLHLLCIILPAACSSSCSATSAQTCKPSAHTCLALPHVCSQSQHGSQCFLVFGLTFPDTEVLDKYCYLLHLNLWILIISV